MPKAEDIRQTCETTCYRRLLKASWMNKIINAIVRERIGPCFTITHTVKDRKLHVLVKDEGQQIGEASCYY